jgi:hypothetical protein
MTPLAAELSSSKRWSTSHLKTNLTAAATKIRSQDPETEAWYSDSHDESDTPRWARDEEYNKCLFRKI